MVTLEELVPQLSATRLLERLESAAHVVTSPVYRLGSRQYMNIDDAIDAVEAHRIVYFSGRRLERTQRSPRGDETPVKKFGSERTPTFSEAFPDIDDVIHTLEKKYRGQKKQRETTGWLYLCTYRDGPIASMDITASDEYGDGAFLLMV